MPGDSLHAEITPAPTDEEAAAVVAAVEALWPTAVAADGYVDGERRIPAWRFSGRWWARPLPARRNRPFR